MGFRVYFFFNDTATTEIYTLSLHDALPIYVRGVDPFTGKSYSADDPELLLWIHCAEVHSFMTGYHHFGKRLRDRKSTRLNSSHANISYAVFCLKKKKTPISLLPSNFATLNV